MLSALGFLAADVRHDYQRVVGENLLDLKTEELRRFFSEMEEDGALALGDEGFTSEQIRFTRILDCRYLRQVYTIPVQASAEELSKDGHTIWMAEAFEEGYSALYRHVHERNAIVVDSVRLVAHGILPSLSLPKEDMAGSDPVSAQRGTRQIFQGTIIDTPCYWFDDLKPGMRITGPALVDSESTTVALPDQYGAVIDPYGSLIITPAEKFS